MGGPGGKRGRGVHWDGSGWWGLSWGIVWVAQGGRSTPFRLPLAPVSLAELQMMVEHHLCKQQQEEEEELGTKNLEQPSPACCPQGDTDHSHSPGGTCPLAPGLARLGAQGGGPAAPEGSE